jgi:galactose mutarotase-like enzyme
MEKVSYQNIEINRWDVGPSTFLASPEKGARLLNWHVNMSDGSVRDVIHWPENNTSHLLQEVHGGIPILFPFAGACFHEGKENHWKCPDGTVRPMPLHGFASDSEFIVRSIDSAGFEVELAQKESDKEFYPFEYTFTVIYHFLELSLQISLILENEGRTPIPWSAGLHPYFQVPWRKNLSRADHLLTIDSKTDFQYHKGGMMTKKPKNSESSRLDNPELINSIHYELKSPVAELSLLNGEETIRISEVGGAEIGSRTSFVTWSEPESPFYCVEPWMSPPNAPENKTVKIVPPSARGEFTVEIELA